jgi:hypothetical protein
MASQRVKSGLRPSDQWRDDVRYRGNSRRQNCRADSNLSVASGRAEFFDSIDPERKFPFSRSPTALDAKRKFLLGQN